MRVLHVADLHCGFRAYERLTGAGMNQREADVARTFRLFIDAAIALQPDVIVVAGDIYHRPNPGNLPVQHAFAQFKRLRAECPAEIVMIGGDHDQGKTREIGSALDLFTHLGIHLATRDAKQFTLQAGGATVVVDTAPRYAKMPTFTKAGDYQLLVMHGDAPNLYPQPSGHEFDPAALVGWDVACLGHYHVHHRVDADVPTFYSGAIDYTSTNPWGELIEERERGVPGKGFMMHDLETGEHEFVPLPPSRTFIDMSLDATGMGSEELSKSIDALCAGVEIDGAVARIVVRECSREVKHGLDWKMFKQYQRRALNLDLDFRKPEPAATSAAVAGITRTQRKPLPEIVYEFLATRGLTNDVSREEFVAAGQAYLAQVDSDGPATAAETVAA